jgi:hypothetical protein
MFADNVADLDWDSNSSVTLAETYDCLGGLYTPFVFYGKGVSEKSSHKTLVQKSDENTSLRKASLSQ